MCYVMSQNNDNNFSSSLEPNTGCWAPKLQAAREREDFLWSGTGSFVVYNYVMRACGRFLLHFLTVQCMIGVKEVTLWSSWIIDTIACLIVMRSDSYVKGMNGKHLVSAFTKSARLIMTFVFFYTLTPRTVHFQNIKTKSFRSCTLSSRRVQVTIAESTFMCTKKSFSMRRYPYFFQKQWISMDILCITGGVDLGRYRLVVFCVKTDERQAITYFWLQPFRSKGNWSAFDRIAFERLGYVSGHTRFVRWSLKE